ncbi:short chain dehydrogenase (chromatophore) [Paulinella micropora]|uniref:Short chain dehydrogenase n=1 Tax=Paulinella micropora TaxID=1928728 RepID=A0A1L5YD53_9EUKA|nr:short chain dehydrogenase [Paulinella micropora]AQX45409.1 short chain dehydrogenase [Paulinella micropora]BBL86629.1 short chain dehydrogenase [Paulinella micropora]
MATVLITGSSRGIGATAARQFALAGWDLLLVARNDHDLADLAIDLRKLGRKVETASIDLASSYDIAPSLAELLERGLTPQVVVNNAGAAYTGSLTEMTLDEWQWLLQLNLTSIFQISKVIIPIFRLNGGGLIINVSSHAARKVFPNWGAYCTAKSALETLTRCIAEEERDYGIRACTLTLGAVDSPLWETNTVCSNFDRRAMLPLEQAAAALVYMAQQSPTQVVEDLTLMPATGAL